MLHWIQPDKRVGGFFGAAVIGSIGAILGTMFALTMYRSITSSELFPVALMTMGLGVFILLISNFSFKTR
jgi:uncharacterized YccA/Bax inhibitor family protein